MASDRCLSRWESLPDEILLQIISYLEPYHVTRLQLVSQRLQKLCVDDDMWKRNCFEDSSWYLALQYRRKNAALHTSRIQPSLDGDVMDESLSSTDSITQDQIESSRRKRWQKMQDVANWDPGFSDEQVVWYDEYIRRNGSISVNWLQMPRIRDREIEAIIEARGMALFNPYDGNDGLGTTLAVSPLDDGSVCLWDVRGTRGRQGAVLARSKPDILFIDGPGEQNARRSKRIDTGVTECVSVSHDGHRAFFAVQSHLIEVDLNRLDVISRESFEWSITTLSPIQDGLPLTVGTSLGIHLHDFRARASVPRDIVDYVDAEAPSLFKSIFDPKPLPPYASLSQPTPISILHLPRPGLASRVSHDIYVSGRFSNILHYDRRKFPAIMSSIYSGALINSLTALPFPFSALDSEIRQRGELSIEQMEHIKSEQEGCTLIAAGSYKTKGSLEIYGLNPPSDTSSRSLLQSSVTKNRYTASSSSILSATTHGTKIVFSDGAGLIKWFERDGFTEIRRQRVGAIDDKDSLALVGPGSGELARKVVSTKVAGMHDRPNNDNILFWTGERLGMMSFTAQPLFKSGDFAASNGDGDPDADRQAEYQARMRDALDHQADEVRQVHRLGYMP